MASTTMPIEKSEKEWRAILFPEQFRVPLLKGTELKVTGEYNKFYEEGIYNLLPVELRFTSLPPNLILVVVGLLSSRVFLEPSIGFVHLAHVFKGEGFKVPTDERHCVNSVTVKFIPGNVASSI
ncbi:hypothetical protein RYX36_001576 [Vicia faba]